MGEQEIRGALRDLMMACDCELQTPHQLQEVENLIELTMRGLAKATLFKGQVYFEPITLGETMA